MHRRCLNLDKYIVNGGKPLSGEVTVHGAKNSVLPILAASVITGRESVITDCPDLSDVMESAEILKHLGCRVKRGHGVITVNSETLNKNEIPEYLMLKMRSSVIFLGALISRCKGGKITLPGGCEIGPRPIDLHLFALREMGIKIEESGGIITCDAANIHPAAIHLEFPSVGATENIMLAATGADGLTVISNAAKEPEIKDLEDYLKKAGVRIFGAGTDKIYIYGQKKYDNCQHRVIPDRIEAATYICGALMTGGDVTIKNTNPMHMEALYSALSECGADIRLRGNEAHILPAARLSAVKRIRTYPYPGFPTDMQSVFMSLMTTADGTSMIVENVFKDRFRQVDPLVRMGADIVTDGNVAIIRGVNSLAGAHVSASDLRGGAALTIAALAAKGTSEIDKICYIERGYEAFDLNLRALGADIRKEVMV